MQGFKIDFSLTKNDMNDFNREKVSELLGITPSRSEGPRLSKGNLRCDSLANATDAIRGITILPSETEMHRYVMHACWEVVISHIEAQNFEDALALLKDILGGTVSTVLDLCKDFNLFAEIVLHVYTKKNNLPDTFLSSETIAFLSSLNASFMTDYHLE